MLEFAERLEEDVGANLVGDAQFPAGETEIAVAGERVDKVLAAEAGAFVVVLPRAIEIGPGVAAGLYRVVEFAEVAKGNALPQEMVKRSPMNAISTAPSTSPPVRRLVFASRPRMRVIR